MNLDIFFSVIGALTSLLAGGLASSELVQRLVRVIFRRESPKKSYSERLTELTDSL
jgi:hypothetical protein